jgi:hypothetical protein
MKRLCVQVMLVCITTGTSVLAAPLASGFGAERAHLSAEQILLRSRQLEESSTFALLRYPDALRAPSRIFSADIWRSIELAARAHNLDPMVLAGMIFIESYGDPLAKSPTGPAGIAQLTKASARELGLATARRVRVGQKAVRKTRWTGTGKNRRRVTVMVQQPVYKTIDERYVPDRAIRAMARRLASRRTWLGGKLDFAIAEYHMGAGRMARLLSAYFERTIRLRDVPVEMAAANVSYAGLFWTNTPYIRPAVFQTLDELNRIDFSPTYYFRVQQAMRLLTLYRQSPSAYEQLASGMQNKRGQDVLPSWQWTFVNAATEPAANEFVLMPDIASMFGIRATTASLNALSAGRATVGTALFVAHHLKQLQGDRFRGFDITRMREVGDGGEEEAALPVHGMGWAFDVLVKGLSKTDARDLKFILTDLRQAGLLAWSEDDRGEAFHVVRHPAQAAGFEQFYWDIMAGN